MGPYFFLPSFPQPADPVVILTAGLPSGMDPVLPGFPFCVDEDVLRGTYTHHIVSFIADSMQGRTD